MHPVEKTLLEDDPTLGNGDVSKCLPGWIKLFCEWFGDGKSHKLDRHYVSALAHTLIAARVRAERLVKERDAAISELGFANMLITQLQNEQAAGWLKS